jgi:hypothetical protein
MKITTVATSLLILWILIISYGILILIVNLISFRAYQIWVLFFANPIVLISYLFMIFPVGFVLSVLKDLIDEKRWKNAYQFIKGFIWQLVIAAIASILLILIYGNNYSLTNNLLLEFFSLFSLLLTFFSIVFVIILILYSYLGDV